MYKNTWNRSLKGTDDRSNWFKKIANSTKAPVIVSKTNLDLADSRDLGVPKHHLRHRFRNCIFKLRLLQMWTWVSGKGLQLNLKSWFIGSMALSNRNPISCRRNCSDWCCIALELPDQMILRKNWLWTVPLEREPLDGKLKQFLFRRITPGTAIDIKYWETEYPDLNCEVLSGNAVMWSAFG